MDSGHLLVLTMHQVQIFLLHKQVHIQAIMMEHMVVMHIVLREVRLPLIIHQFHLISVVVFGILRLHKLVVLQALLSMGQVHMLIQIQATFTQKILICEMAETQFGMMDNQTLQLRLMSHQHQELTFLN